MTIISKIPSKNTSNICTFYSIIQLFCWYHYLPQFQADDRKAEEFIFIHQIHQSSYTIKTDKLKLLPMQYQIIKELYYHINYEFSTQITYIITEINWIESSTGTWLNKIEWMYTCACTSSSRTVKTFLLQYEARPNKQTRQHSQYQPSSIIRNPHRSLSIHNRERETLSLYKFVS